MCFGGPKPRQLLLRTLNWPHPSLWLLLLLVRKVSSQFLPRPRSPRTIPLMPCPRRYAHRGSRSPYPVVRPRPRHLRPGRQRRQHGPRLLGAHVDTKLSGPRTHGIQIDLPSGTSVPGAGDADDALVRAHISRPFPLPSRH